jgi:hypothetical protein
MRLRQQYQKRRRARRSWPCMPKAHDPLGRVQPPTPFKHGRAAWSTAGAPGRAPWGVHGGSRGGRWREGRGGCAAGVPSRGPLGGAGRACPGTAGQGGVLGSTLGGFTAMPGADPRGGRPASSTTVAGNRGISCNPGGDPPRTSWRPLQCTIAPRRIATGPWWIAASQPLALVPTPD